MANHQFIDRSLGDRLIDLRTSLLLIRDCLDAIKNGKSHFVIPIFSQLRALLVEKRKDNAPLMLEIANIFGVDPEIYWMPGGLDKVKDIVGGVSPIFHMSGFPISLHKVFPKQETVSISALLKKDLIAMGDKRFSLATIIKIGAEKAGGAHWAKRLSPEEQDLISFNLSGLHPLPNLQPLHQAITQFSQTVLDFGHILLSKIITQHIHFIALITDQVIHNEVTIFSFGYPDKSNSILLSIGPNRGLKAILMSYNTEQVSLQCAPNIDTQKFHHFEISHELDDKLHSTFSIRMDGKMMGKTAVPFPILYDGRENNAEMHLNVPFNNQTENQGIEFGISDLLVRSESVDDYARENLNIYFAHSIPETSQFMLLTPETRGYKSSGKGDLTFDPPATFSTIESFFKEKGFKTK